MCIFFQNIFAIDALMQPEVKKVINPNTIIFLVFAKGIVIIINHNSCHINTFFHNCVLFLWTEVMHIAFDSQAE